MKQTPLKRRAPLSSQGTGLRRKDSGNPSSNERRIPRRAISPASKAQREKAGYATRSTWGGNWEADLNATAEAIGDVRAVLTAYHQSLRERGE